MPFQFEPLRPATQMLYRTNASRWIDREFEDEDIDSFTRITNPLTREMNPYALCSICTVRLFDEDNVNRYGCTVTYSYDIYYNDNQFNLCTYCMDQNMTCYGCYCITDSYYSRSQPRIHETTLRQALSDGVAFMVNDHENLAHVYCAMCIGESLFTCEACEFVYPFSSQSFLSTCLNCDDQQPEIVLDTTTNNTQIRGYSYKPAPNFLKMPWEKALWERPVGFGVVGKKDDPLYIGVEYEIETSDRYAVNPRKIVKTFMDTVEHYHSGPASEVAYAKSDGSLNDGVEIVSHPGSFDWWKNMNNPFIRAVEECDQQNLINASSRCGMHMHINKSAFTSYHLHKFSKFMFSEENKQFIHKVSGRPGNDFASYAHWESINASRLRYIAFASDTKDVRYKVAKVQNVFNNGGRRHSTQDSRSCIVNFMNPATIEMRLFGGSSDSSDVLAHVDFCHALYVFSRENPPHKMSHVYFNLFLRKNSRTYRHLCNFLNIEIAKKIKPGVKIREKRKAEKGVVTV